MPDRPTAEKPAMLVDRYELSSLLGSGGMAEVYRAHDTLLGRDVAVKVFRTAVTDERFDARQRAEISLLASLDHPGLVTIFDAGSGSFAGGPQRAFLVMELVPGLSLADRIAQGKLPASSAATVGAHVAEALAYIHHLGVVHRDVKPANILLPGSERGGTAEAWTKLTDFGIARLVEDAHLTSTGLLLGTPGYLSPEQAMGTSPGPPTDVYALGLVVLECRTGARAFAGTALESVAARLHSGPVIPAELGTGWTRLLAAMTARKAADRPTAIEAGCAFRELLGATAPTRAMPAAAGVGPGVGRTAPTISMDDGATLVRRAPTDDGSTLVRRAPMDDGSGPGRVRSGRRARIWAAAGAVVLCAAIGGGLWLDARDPGPGPTPVPSYPAVQGPLGADLTRLQKSVSP